MLNFNRDYILNYRGRMGVTSMCAYEFAYKDTGGAVVTVKEHPDNNGTSTAIAFPDIAKLIYEYAKSEGFPVSRIDLWETPKCFASYLEE